MATKTDHDPATNWLNRVLLNLAEERSVERVLDLIVCSLAARERVGLARIWLIEPGDICRSCVMRTECPNQSTCLHLAASAGQSLADPSADWSRLDGDFRRFPLGIRKVGHIGSSGNAVEIPDIEAEPTWIARPEWARQEQIRGFAGQPLIFRGQILGVLSVFTRALLDHEDFVRSRVLADHAAAAIANARSLREVEQLKKQLQVENQYLREEALSLSSEILGRSPAIWRVLAQIDRVATTEARVLILGESGTGKELVARELHRRSARAERAMIKVNCAAISSELYESEFFGHRKGAYTGATDHREGRFELADQGTLFLDEVGEIPLALQSKLLRVLEDGQFERVGEGKTRSVDIRLIASTNKDLQREADEGRFRQDLYYRLNVYPIHVPPLRERKEDIPILTKHLVEQAAVRMKCPQPRLTDAHHRQLQEYDWPGNVRELRNVIERAVINSGGGAFPLDFQGLAKNVPGAVMEDDSQVLSEQDLRRFERKNIEKALAQCGWKIYGENGVKRPRFSWTRIKGESNVQGGGGNGSVEGRGTGRGIGADGGSPEGDWSPCRRGGGRGGLPGAGAAVERQPEARRGAAAAAWRIAGGAVP